MPVQSHLSENQGEIEWVKQLRPDAAFYGDGYDKYDLFGDRNLDQEKVRTVMAHCVWSTDDEVRRIKDNGVFIAHCPASNMNLSSGIAPIRKYLDLDMKVGLDDSALKAPNDLNIRQRIERAIYLSLDLNGIVAKYAAGRKIC